MSFFNDAQRDGLLTGRYICSECGGLMEFEDEWEDILTRPLTKPSRILIVKKTKDFIGCCIHCFTCASWLALRSKVGLF